ncbi:MAG: alpha/beta hydrolase [Pseudomonadota bacterium]
MHNIRNIAIAAALTCAAAPGVFAGEGLLSTPFFGEAQSLTVDERTLVWSEIGAAEGRPLVFAVGFPHAAVVGTGVLSPFDGFLKRNNIRLIAVERTGATNRSTFTLTDTLDDYVSDVETILAQLNVDRFSVLAFSAGGPGALALAARFPERVRSVHLMAARGRYTDELAERSAEQDAFETLIDDPLGFAPLYQNFPPPRALFDPNDMAFLDANFGTDFLDFYFAKAIQTLDQNPEGLSASRAIGYQPWSFELGDVQAPVFVYQGWADSSILATGYSQDTAARVGGAVSVRFYPAESHFETHLRHFDQVIVDMQTLGAKFVMCVPRPQAGSSVTRQVPVALVARRLREGARLGDCLWQ